MGFLKWMSEEIYQYKYRVLDTIVNVVKDPEQELIPYEYKASMIRTMIVVTAIAGAVHYKSIVDEQEMQKDRFFLKEQQQIRLEKELAAK